MVLFSSSCARLTQIQMKANRLKISWALGTVLRASTTEPLLQGRAVLSQQLLLPASVAALLEKSAFKEKQTKPPYTSTGHQVIVALVTLIPGATRCDRAILCSTPQACNTPSLLLHLPLGTGKCCQAQPCTWWAGNSTWSDLPCCLACYLLPHLPGTDR